MSNVAVASCRKLPSCVNRCWRARRRESRSCCCAPADVQMLIASMTATMPTLPYPKTDRLDVVTAASHFAVRAPGLAGVRHDADAGGLVLLATPPATSLVGAAGDVKL